MQKSIYRFLNTCYTNYINQSPGGGSMNSYKKALDKFISANESDLLDTYKEAFIYEQTSHPKIDWEGLPICYDSFVEWVEEKYVSEINALEDQLKDENKSLSEQARGYANQVMADYKLAQTGKY